MNLENKAASLIEVFFVLARGVDLVPEGKVQARFSKEKLCPVEEYWKFRPIVPKTAEKVCLPAMQEKIKA